jgi:hypothetical protein
MSGDLKHLLDLSTFVCDPRRTGPLFVASQRVRDGPVHHMHPLEWARFVLGHLAGGVGAAHGYLRSELLPFDNAAW